jgi:hypothetical protein
MLKQILRSKLFVTIFMVLALSCPNAFAWGGHGGGRHENGGRYYYHGGRWHGGSSWFWFDAGVTALAIGAIAETLPPRYTTVVVSGNPYYYYEGAYYQPYPSGGYVVVPAPSAQAANPVAEQNSFTVNIPDSRGGYKAVVIEKIKGGFRGPQGEFYSEFPSVEQLRVMYGHRK